MRNAKHRRRTFIDRHEDDLIFLMVALAGILTGISTWLAF